MVVQDNFGDPADAEVAARWRDGLGLDFTVLGDPEGAWAGQWSGNPAQANHSYTVLDRDGAVVFRQTSGSSTTVDILSAAAFEAARED